MSFLFNLIILVAFLYALYYLYTHESAEWNGGICKRSNKVWRPAVSESKLTTAYTDGGENVFVATVHSSNSKLPWA